MKLTPTASQTVGPFFNFGLTTNRCLGVLTRDGAEGERIQLEFRMLDGEDAPAPGDAMVELWQADAQGRYAHSRDPRCAEADSNFYGFGRMETDGDGLCVFHTIKPGCVPGCDGALQAPHINVTVFARGLLKHLHTRVYFSGEASNEKDPVLALVPAERRSTLLAQPVTGQHHMWHMDIRLQGERETVFFDV